MKLLQRTTACITHSASLSKYIHSSFRQDPINHVFSSVYVAGQVLKKLLQEHPKVQGQQAVAEEKAQVIYRALEAHPATYQIIPDRSVRSRMNICFRIKGGADVEEKAFLADAAALGLTGLKGHRSVGGIRASNYNSISREGAEKLAKFIGTFATRQ